MDPEIEKIKLEVSKLSSGLSRYIMKYMQENNTEPTVLLSGIITCLISVVVGYQFKPHEFKELLIQVMKLYVEAKKPFEEFIEQEKNNGNT